MKTRPTQAQIDASRALLAAVAARLGVTKTSSEQAITIGDDVVACVSSGGAKVAVLSVAGFDGHTVTEAMPAAFRTPTGRPEQVWEVVALIAERQAERARRAPEMAELARRAEVARAS